MNISCSLTTFHSTVGERETNWQTGQKRKENQKIQHSVVSFYLFCRFLKPGRKRFLKWKWCFEIFLVKEVVCRSFWSIKIFSNRKAERLAGLHLFWKIKPSNKKRTLGSKGVESLYLGRLNWAVKILLVTSISGLKRAKPHGSLAQRPYSQVRPCVHLESRKMYLLFPACFIIYHKIGLTFKFRIVVCVLI